MSNKDIIRSLRLIASLLELHEANEFKIKGYQSAIYQLEKTSEIINSLSKEQLSSGDLKINKPIIATIEQLISLGYAEELETLISQTPEGVMDLLNIKGIGPKKIRTLWKEHQIETVDRLLEACQNNEVASIKGFGAKTQENILQGILFMHAQKGKFLFAEICNSVESLQNHFETLLKDCKVKLIGDVALENETVEKVAFLVGTDTIHSVYKTLCNDTSITHDLEKSSPFRWEGKWISPEINIQLLLCPLDRFENEAIVNSAEKAHLSTIIEGKTILKHLKDFTINDEISFYTSLGLPYIKAPFRTGIFEFKEDFEAKQKQLIAHSDLKGILHNHSTYSDGKDTLRAMAMDCIEKGYQYLGITDHSASAFYANGLKADIVAKQHEEIDLLNKELAPFKILKGIESDILVDGSLDYAEEVLASFDFIVSSIHSVLNMDIAKATQRLITAIENPYTTILGHPTGRLLLRREGYPIDHKAVIDACAENNVVIELNSNPWRMDMDWRWIDYALSKNVMISINPDAHEIKGFSDMGHGIRLAQKGGLTKSMTLNAMSLQEIETYFANKKNRAVHA